MIRLRQVALVASDLASVVGELCERLAVGVCFRDPGVAEFGLRNALMTIGDQFLEVVSPTRPGTTAGRLLERRGGDGGYMAIYEVDDLDARLARIAAHGVRTVWGIDLPDIRTRHLHPRDVGGAIVSLDQPVPQGAWRWGGPDWRAHAETSVATGIAGVAIGAADPEAMRARWAELGIEHAVRFQPAGPHGEGIDELELVAADRRRAGVAQRIGSVSVRLV